MNKNLGESEDTTTLQADLVNGRNWEMWCICRPRETKNQALRRLKKNTKKAIRPFIVISNDYNVKMEKSKKYQSGVQFCEITIE
jgi:hypothetical protein